MLRKKLTFNYDKLKKTKSILIIFYEMVHVKNYCVSLNDKDKLDKWTKCQGVSDYGG